MQCEPPVRNGCFSKGRRRKKKKRLDPLTLEGDSLFAEFSVASLALDSLPLALWWGLFGSLTVELHLLRFHNNPPKKQKGIRQR